MHARGPCPGAAWHGTPPARGQLRRGTAVALRALLSSPLPLPAGTQPHPHTPSAPCSARIQTSCTGRACPASGSCMPRWCATAAAAPVSPACARALPPWLLGPCTAAACGSSCVTWRCRWHRSLGASTSPKRAAGSLVPTRLQRCCSACDPRLRLHAVEGAGAAHGCSRRPAARWGPRPVLPLLAAATPCCALCSSAAGGPARLCA